MAKVKMQETMETVERFIISQMSAQSITLNPAIDCRNDLIQLGYTPQQVFNMTDAEVFHTLDNMDNKEEYQVFPDACSKCKHPHVLVTGYSDNTDAYSFICPNCHNTYEAGYNYYDEIMDFVYEEHEELLSQMYSKPFQLEEIVVIGKPMFTNLFEKDGYKFTFLEGEEAANYKFNNETECWVLDYELTGQARYMLKKSSNLPVNTRTFKQFGDVRPLLDVEAV